MRRLAAPAQTSATPTSASSPEATGEPDPVTGPPPPVAGSDGKGVEVGSAVGSAASWQVTRPSSTSTCVPMGNAPPISALRESGLLPSCWQRKVIDASTVSLVTPAALAPVTRNDPALRSRSHTPPCRGRHSTTETTSASYVISIVHAPRGSAMSVVLSSTDPSSPTSITSEPT